MYESQAVEGAHNEEYGPSLVSQVLRIVVVLALIVAGFFAGRVTKPSSGAGTVGDAAKTMATVFRAQLTGDTTTYFDYLYPGQQAKVDQKTFERCVARLALSYEPTVVGLDEYADPNAKLGVPETEVKVVTVQIRSADGATARIVYTVKAGGKWRWLLGQKELDAYSQGRCVGE